MRSLPCAQDIAKADRSVACGEFVTQFSGRRYGLRMRIPPHSVALAATVAATLALPGCAQEPPPIIPTAQPTSAPVFRSDAEALAAAKEAYIAYLSVADQILVDGGDDPQKLLTVATSAELDHQIPGFVEERMKHWHSTGGTILDSITLQSFDPTRPPGSAMITVYGCVDVSHVDVLDADNHSVVSPTRPKVSAFQTTFILVRRTPPRLVVSSEVPWQGAYTCRS